MKTLKSTALVLGLFGLLAGTTTLVRAQDYQDNYQDDGYSTGNVSLQTFYDELSPYGTWIQDPQYGYVWRPDVDQSDFRPYYTNGRWAMTEYGNTWVSNYDWGWAPFHYGRWVINSYRQWIWLPDTNWGPAWVDWRSGDGYYGWAPMAPSISINLSFGRRYSVPEFCWNFIPQSNIYINSFPRYDYGRNNVYIRNTTIINNTYVYNRRSYYGGPRMEDIRRATNRDVRVYRFDQSSRPGASRVSGRDVSIYRPRPDRNVDNRSAAPRKFEQGNAGFNRNGRNANNGNRDSRTNDNNNNNRFGQGNNGRTPQTGSRTDGNVNRGDNNSATNRGDVFNRGNNGRADRGGQTNGDANQRSREGLGRGNDQRTQTDQNNQRNQTDRSAQMEQQRQQRSQQADQQRQQRDAQAQQQRAQQGQQQQQERSAQMEQQRAQRSQQIQEAQQQQRAQRDAQAQQQRSQQADQQRAQMEQQRQQRDAQAQQQRQQQQQQQQQQRMERTRTESAPPQQQQQNRGGGERSSSEGGRPSRSGRG